MMNDNGEAVFSAVNIGKRIAARRKQLGMTQEQAAEASGLSHQFFSSIEAGKKNMRVESVIKLCRALDISADYILLGTSNASDLNYLASMLQPFNETQLRCAEEIIKNLLIACGKQDNILG